MAVAGLLGGRHVDHDPDDLGVDRLHPVDGVAELVARTHIIDGRNVLDVASWNAAGWTVEALGRTLTP